MTDTRSADAPVLVVGAGPVGCVLALELARYGVRSVVLERSELPSRHPKMDYVSARSMELLRRLDVAAEIRTRGVAAGHPLTFLWTLGFDRPPVATWQEPSVAEWTERYAGLDDGTGGAEAYQRVQGSLLESLLRRRIEEHPLVEVRPGVRLTDLQTSSDGVLATTQGSPGEQQLVARYLAGCDGAGSTVRNLLGIERDLLAPPSQHCSVYFRSADPALRKHGRAFVTIAAAGLTLVSRDERDTWTASLLLFDGQVPDDPMTAVQERLGISFAVDDLISIAAWEGALGLARQYRRGNAFLAGDAAHQFHPTGGLGANTGLADAVDLGWKLAAVLHGWGGPRLLDSYQAERRPVAELNLETSGSLLEVWRRFGRLGRARAPVPHIADYLAREAYQPNNLGVHLDYRYDRSPVVPAPERHAPPWHWDAALAQPWPGGRAPDLPLEDGGRLHDLFGPGLTLLDLQAAGASAVPAAADRGVPLTRVTVPDVAVRKVWPALALVRPDQHVAWTGEVAPADWGAVLDQVCGR